MSDATPAASVTPLVLLEELEDAPDEGREADQWPYPTKYIKSRAQGELAERIRRALGVTDDLPVYVTERTESGGWSSWTQEDDCYITVEVGNATREIDAGWSGGLAQLLRWLDAEAPVSDEQARRSKPE